MAHKKISVVILIVILILGYWIYKTINPTTVQSTYLLGSVTKGTIVSTITGTGQVSAENQLDLTPKVSGVITSIRVQPGDHIGSGQTLFVIDARDAQKKVRDAELDLQLAQASLDSSTTSNDLAVENAYTSLLNSSFEAMSADATTEKSARPTISGNYILGKEGTINISTYASTGGISASFKGLVDDASLISTVNPVAIGKSGLFILFPTSVTAGMNWTISIPNKNASNYISNKINYEQALHTQAEAKIANSTALLNIQAKKNALDDAKETLSDYYVGANFNGIVASVPVKVGEQASVSTTLSTIITNQKIATIPLNEVDIAKVKTGQKVTATFDAIEGLEITGHVLAVDLIGTVTSGVVNYNVKVGFDTNDDRIKSGMSTNVSIATAVAQDVLMVPTSAIKNSNGNYYVQLAPAGSTVTTGNTGVTLGSAPTQVEITKGIADDLNTEIVSGLKEGDIIVTKTITTTVAATAAPSILSGVGARSGTGGASGATRAIGR